MAEPDCQKEKRGRTPMSDSSEGDNLSFALAQEAPCSRSQTEHAMDLWIPVKKTICGEWAFHDSSVLVRKVSVMREQPGPCMRQDMATRNKMSRMFRQQTMHKSLSAINIRWYFDKETRCGTTCHNMWIGWIAVNPDLTAELTTLLSLGSHPSTFCTGIWFYPLLTHSSFLWGRIWSFFYIWFSYSQIYFL